MGYFDTVVVVSRSLPRDGGMARDRGALKIGQLPRAGPDVLDKKGIAKRRAAHTVRSR